MDTFKNINGIINEEISIGLKDKKVSIKTDNGILKGKNQNDDYRPITMIDNWKQNQKYTQDVDFIIYGNNLYKCLVTHTSLNIFDSSKWTALSSMNPATPMDFHMESLPSTRTGIIRDWQVESYNTGTNELHIYLNGKRLSLQNNDYIELDSQHVRFNFDVQTTDLLVAEVNSGNSKVSDYLPNHYYSAKDLIVYNNNSLYRSKSDHLSASTFETDVSYWDLIASSQTSKGYERMNYLQGIRSTLQSDFLCPVNTVDNLLVFREGALLGMGEDRDYTLLDSSHIHFNNSVDTSEDITFIALTGGNGNGSSGSNASIGTSQTIRTTAIISDKMSSAEVPEGSTLTNLKLRMRQEYDLNTMIEIMINGTTPVTLLSGTVNDLASVGNIYNQDMFIELSHDNYGKVYVKLTNGSGITQGLIDVYLTYTEAFIS